PQRLDLDDVRQGPPRDGMAVAAQAVLAELLLAEDPFRLVGVAEPVLPPPVGLADRADGGEVEVRAIGPALVRERPLELGRLEAEPFDARTADALAGRFARGIQVLENPPHAHQPSTARLRALPVEEIRGCHGDDVLRANSRVRDGEGPGRREDAGQVDHGVAKRRDPDAATSTTSGSCAATWWTTSPRRRNPESDAWWTWMSRVSPKSGRPCTTAADSRVSTASGRVIRYADTRVR